MSKEDAEEMRKRFEAEKKKAEKNMKGCLPVIVILLLVVIFSGGDDKKGVSDIDRKVVIQEMVRMKLRDPSSARFRNVYVSNAGGSPIVCGSVNAKNGFGAYIGYKLFVGVGPDPALVIMQSATKEFNEIWNKYCVEENS